MLPELILVSLVGDHTSAALLDSSECTYTYQLICLDTKCAPLVKHATGIQLLRKMMQNDGSDGAVPVLEFRIVFAPPMEFRYRYFLLSMFPSSPLLVQRLITDPLRYTSSDNHVGGSSHNIS